MEVQPPRRRFDRQALTRPRAAFDRNWSGLPSSAPSHDGRQRRGEQELVHWFASGQVAPHGIAPRHILPVV